MKMHSRYLFELLLKITGICIPYHLTHPTTLSGQR